MTRDHWTILISALLGVTFPLAALTTGFETIVAPFGWTRLAVVHLLAMAPLSLVLARLVPRPKAWTPCVCLAVGAAALGVAVNALTFWHGPAFDQYFDARTPSFVGRLAIRVFWCFGLQWPLCVTGMCFMQRRADAAEWTTGATVSWCAAGFCAVGLPAFYAHSLVAVATAEADELLRAGRLVAMDAVLAPLRDVGSHALVAGRDVAAWQRKRQADVRDARAIIENPAMPAVDRARALAQLDRIDEALGVLEPVAAADAAALTLRAAIWQHKKSWQESSRDYRSALKMLESGPGSNATSLGLRVKCYDALAFNARESEAPKEAEAIYLEAMEVLPSAKAHFHFQLGRHYQIAGRPGAALDHLETAARLMPQPYGELSRPLIEKVRTQTPGCLLRIGH